MNSPDRWEYGSEFHLIRRRGNPAAAPWDNDCVMTGSGRDSLRLLVEFGVSERGWQRIRVPSYFCQDVVSAVSDTGIDIRAYPCGPLDPDLPASDAEPDSVEVWLRVNFFGLHSKPAVRREPAGVEIIEDHTHDPWSAWSYTSDADWCIASLRKTLPLPDGGVLWSPKRHALPPQPSVTECRSTASMRKLLGMVLKGIYLDGHPARKATFRDLLVSGEKAMGEGDVSGMTEWSRDMLSGFPTRVWRSRRLKNHRRMSEALAGVDWGRVLQPSFPGGATPFSAILLFDTGARREHVRRRLIESNVFPAVLWCLERPVVDRVPVGHVDLSRRLLSIHCDMRYNEADLLRVCSLVSTFGEEHDRQLHAGRQCPAR